MRGYTGLQWVVNEIYCTASRRYEVYTLKHITLAHTH